MWIVVFDEVTYHGSWSPCLCLGEGCSSYKRFRWPCTGSRPLSVLLPLLPGVFPDLLMWLTYLVEVCLLNTLACDYAFDIGEMLAFGKER